MGIGWFEQWARFCKKERDSCAKYPVGCAALNKSSKSNTLDAFPKSTSFLAPPLSVSPFALPFRAIAAVAAAIQMESGKERDVKSKAFENHILSAL